MIGYFVKAGDHDVGEIFRPYIWGASGLGKRLKKIEHKDYGEGLSLLLIQYYVEGKFPIFGPHQLKVRNYSTKNKAISVAIPVKHSDFHDVRELQRRQFILSSTIAAIDAVEARLKKRKLNVDFASLRDDVKRIGRAFVEDSKDVSSIR